MAVALPAVQVPQQLQYAQPIHHSPHPEPAAPAMVQRTVTPAATAMANATGPAASTISWDRLQQPAAQRRTLLQRVTPVHMGVLLILVILATVVTSGPAAMDVQPSKLPAVVSGGGVGDPLLQPRAGATAVAAATAAGTTAAAPKETGAKLLDVGSATVPASVHSGGIPSAAASANLDVAITRPAAGGGEAGIMQMDGIPSPAAAAQLGPQTLPKRPSDGVTLPRSGGERDSHAIDSHYDADTLPMEAAVELPAMTPGEAAERSAARADAPVVSGGGTAGAPTTSGGLIVAI